jgi:hypothetical protein
MQERPVEMGRKCKKARNMRLNARKGLRKWVGNARKLGKGGLMQERPV